MILRNHQPERNNIDQNLDRLINKAILITSNKVLLYIALTGIDRNCDVLPIVEYTIETDDGQTLN